MTCSCPFSESDGDASCNVAVCPCVVCHIVTVSEVHGQPLYDEYWAAVTESGWAGVPRSIEESEAFQLLRGACWSAHWLCNDLPGIKVSLRLYRSAWRLAVLRRTT